MLPLVPYVLISILASGSPAEPWIVFSSARSGDGDLYAVSPTRGTSTLLVGTTAGEGGARYDASRDRIVHQRFGDDGGQIVSGDSTLFADPTGDAPPAWSPDGSWIAYAARRDGREDVFVAQADGRAERAVTADDVDDRYVSWSPDGDHLLFARRTVAGWGLFTLDPFDRSASPEPVGTEAAYIGHPVWSPDGTRIAFDADYDGQTEIAVLDVGTGRVMRLTDRDGNDLAPAWSPDGRLIAFAGEPAGTGNWDVWTVDVESRELTRVTSDPAFDGGPVFVPSTAIDP